MRLIMPTLALLVATCSACQLGQGGGAAEPGNANDPTGNGNVQQGGTGTTGGTNGNQPANNMPAPAPVPVQGPRTIGRFATGSKSLTWSGTAIEAEFTGTGGTANFVSQSGNNYVGVSIDGGDPVKMPVIGARATVSFGPVASGNHTVRFTKLNEAELGTFSYGDITINGGRLAAITPNSKRLEFIGDSITVGYGVEGTSPCNNNANLENSQKAWALTTADALGADASLIAWSGRGILRNGVGVTDTTTMGTIYKRAAATDFSSVYDFSAAQAPAAVIINLGTNDYTYLSYSGGEVDPSRAILDQTAFVAAYVSLVQQVRAAYPKAFIVLVSSPMLSDTYPSTGENQWSSLNTNITEVVATLADSNVTSLSLPTQNTRVTGCDGHPSAATHASMSAALVPLLRSKLNW